MRLSLNARVVSMLMRAKLPEDESTLEEVAEVLNDLEKLGDRPDPESLRKILTKLEPKEV